ncbi:hypothetical protein Tsubulata_049019 [Turnera subulata]|uniref:NAC domain-containing protein n=1 Tax=Turnera subulata TaxID=218843 RepID=A0A9Q0FIM6_9ROSI|nr:hypothetical protein Tsubulata_049019 [Turnera subulata]
MDCIPVGYRFKPSDEVLMRFLQLKVEHGQQFSVIPEADVYKEKPWTLPGILESHPHLADGERYYFVRRERASKNGKGRRPSRRMKRADEENNIGWWKANTTDCEIRRKSEVLGYKRSLNFFLYTTKEKSTKNGQRSEWIMHEYTLVPTPNQIFQEWSLCKIKNKAKASKEDHPTIAGVFSPVPSIPSSNSLVSIGDVNNVGQEDGLNQEQMLPPSDHRPTFNYSDDQVSTNILPPAESPYNSYMHTNTQLFAQDHVFFEAGDTNTAAILPCQADQNIMSSLTPMAMTTQELPQLDRFLQPSFVSEEYTTDIPWPPSSSYQGQETNIPPSSMESSDNMQTTLLAATAQELLSFDDLLQDDYQPQQGFLSFLDGF